MFTSQLLHKHFFSVSVNNDTNPADKTKYMVMSRDQNAG